MALKIEDKGSYKHLILQSNRLDKYSAGELVEKLYTLTQERNENILLNMRNCSVCDPSGLSAIHVGRRFCENAGATFILTGIRDSIGNLIKSFNLDSLWHIAEDQDEVERLLRKSKSC